MMICGNTESLDSICGVLLDLAMYCLLIIGTNTLEPCLNKRLLMETSVILSFICRA